MKKIKNHHFITLGLFLLHIGLFYVLIERPDLIEKFVDYIVILADKVNESLTETKLP